VSLIVLAFAGSGAHAATGDLTYQGCLSGDLAVGPSGTNACSLFPGAANGGSNSGLDQPLGIVVSPDGTSAYAAAHLDDAIARFSRDPSTGALTYLDCISGRTETTGCTQIGSAKSNGVDSGLDEPWGIVISPNGVNVYVTAQEDDSVATFSRNTGTGALFYQGCITGERATGPAGGGGNDSCATTVAVPTAGGGNSGIDKVRNLAIDPNGESLYATSGQDDALSHFTRNTETGVLTYVDCFTAETQTGPTGGGGSNACVALPGIVSFGGGSGFDNPQAVTVSPNGAQVYVGSGNDASITRFTRTAGAGALSWADCVTRETGIASCAIFAGDQANGSNTGMDNIRAVAVSQDGASVYALGGFDASIVHFARNTSDGSLDLVSCLSGDSNTGPTPGTGDCTLIPSATASEGDQSGWAIASNAPALVIRSDGTQVYFGTAGDDSVVQLDRNTGSGALTFRRCFTSESESAVLCNLISPSNSFGLSTGLDSINGLAISGDGRSLYSSSSTTDSLGRFAIEPAPPAPAAPAPAKKKKKCKKKKKHKHSASAAKKKCKKKKKKK